MGRVRHVAKGCGMGRTMASASMFGLALCGIVSALPGVALAQKPEVQFSDGPALAPPADAPSGVPGLMIRPTPPTISSTPIGDQGPILALPGVIRPRTFAAKPAETPPPLGDLPTLAAPAEMTPRPLPRQLSGGASSPPLTLESEPSEKSTTRPNSRSHPIPPPQPKRRPGIFGRVLGGPPPSNRTIPADPDDEIAMETHSDPAQIASLRRQIERQARSAVGDRARDVEVRIKGKDVHIRVTGTKRFQKRGVRAALEHLPTSNGYRTIIDAVD